MTFTQGTTVLAPPIGGALEKTALIVQRQMFGISLIFRLVPHGSSIEDCSSVTPAGNSRSVRDATYLLPLSRRLPSSR